MFDQVISGHPGLCPEWVYVIHTRDKITAGSVFLDSKTDHSFTHLQIFIGSEEKIVATRVSELMSDTHGVTVKSYHADNGRFSEKAFRDETITSDQRITFCGVDARCQNGCKTHWYINTWL